MQRPKSFLIVGFARIYSPFNPFGIDVHSDNKPPAEREISLRIHESR